ncbi:MAG TPA: hypothetical protein VGK69_00975 [Gaiellaceae bacterium]
MARTCVFCGSDKNLTGEHAVPLWISRLLISEGPIKHETGQDRPTWEGRYVEARAKRICVECNNGWMSRLENAVQPFVGQLVKPTKGRKTIHRRSEKRNLALWIYKTALMMQLATGGPTPIPESAYRYVGEHKSPPPLTRVWFGLFNLPKAERHVADAEFRRLTSYRSTHLDLQTADGTAFRGYAAAFHIAYLGAYVFGYDSGFGEYVVHAPGFRDLLIPVLPDTGASLYWPPPKSLDDAVLDALVAGFLA